MQIGVHLVIWNVVCAINQESVLFQNIHGQFMYYAYKLVAALIGDGAFCHQ